MSSGSRGYALCSSISVLVPLDTARTPGAGGQWPLGHVRCSSVLIGGCEVSLRPCLGRLDGYWMRPNGIGNVIDLGVAERYLFPTQQ